MNRRLAAGLSSALVSIGLLAAGIAQAGEGAVNVQGSKKLNSGYSSIEKANVKKGKSRVVYFRVENTTGLPNDVVLSDELFASTPGRYKVDWYKGAKVAKNQKITSAVRGDGFQFVAQADKLKQFTARVKYKGNGSSLCFRANLNSSPDGFDSAFFSINGPCNA